MPLFFLFKQKLVCKGNPKSPLTFNSTYGAVTMENPNQEKLKILRLKKVKDRTGLSRSTIYLRIQEGTFPKPINLGARAVGWLENEIEAFLASCLENRDSRKEVQ
jgi:prophage regulatory protein